MYFAWMMKELIKEVGMVKERYKKHRGFTLIELVIVIAIMLILAGSLLPIISTNREEARTARAQSDVDMIRSAASMLFADTGVWAPAGGTTCGGIDFCNDGAGLVTNDDGSGVTIDGWNGPYLTEWRNDPWGNAYRIYDENAAVSGNRWAQCLGSDGLDASCGGASDDLCILITPAD